MGPVPKQNFTLDTTYKWLSDSDDIQSEQPPTLKKQGLRVDALLELYGHRVGPLLKPGHVLGYIPSLKRFMRQRERESSSHFKVVKVQEMKTELRKTALGPTAISAHQKIFLNAQVLK